MVKGIFSPSSTTVKILDFPRMDKHTSQQFRTRVAERLAALGISNREASKRAGMNPDTLGKFLSGKTKSLKANNLSALARVLDVSESWLMGSVDDPSIGEIPFGVKFGGTVEAGAFRPRNDLDQDAEIRVPIPHDSRYPADAQFAFKVLGDSMTEARIYEGMHLLAVDLHAWERLNGEPGDGAVVVVARTRRGSPERELTVKRLRIKRDRLILQPETLNPKHKAIELPLPGAHDSAESDETAEILAVCLQAVWLLG